MISFSKEQVFVVTGASSGLGEGVCLLLNELGATVVGVARNKERLLKMKEKCKSPENCFIEERDFSSGLEGLPEFVKMLKEKYGKFRGMAICHGISKCQPGMLLNYNGIKELFDVDYFAPMLLAKGFTDKRNNIGRGASLVAISSFAADACNRGMIEYSGAKSALRASMKCLAKEMALFGIRVNTVSPSDIKTPMVLSDAVSTTRGIDDFEKKYYPMGFGEVSDVANMIVYLLSDHAKWLSGHDYIIDGCCDL